MGFKRPKYEAPAVAPLSPLTRAPNYSSTSVAVPVPKETPERSESYRRWVASLPCVVCGIEGYTQAAHPNKGRGKGQKASDLDCFPLCATRPGHMGHHYEHDNLVGMTREVRRELETAYTAYTRSRAVSEGIL